MFLRTLVVVFSLVLASCASNVPLSSAVESTPTTSQGVDKESLVGEGKGITDLLLPEKPKSAENRRVRITTQQ